jgi:hypothetical protein
MQLNLAGSACQIQYLSDELYLTKPFTVLSFLCVIIFSFF